MAFYTLLVSIMILGWAGGALLNYLADLVPTRRETAVPFCTKCGKPMAWKNYLLWPRKCTFCKSSRSWRTWFVELLAMGSALWLWLSPPVHLGFVVGLALLLYFGLIVMIDIEHHLVLLWMCLVGGVIGLAVGAWTNGILETIIGGVVGFITMLVLFYAGKLLLKWLTRKQKDEGKRNDEALGFGDVILGGVVGLLLGYKVILTGLVIAIFIGSLYSIIYLFVLLVTRRYHKLTMIPYGPFLIAGTLVLLYFPGVASYFAPR